MRRSRNALWVRPFFRLCGVRQTLRHFQLFRQWWICPPIGSRLSKYTTERTLSNDIVFVIQPHVDMSKRGSGGGGFKDGGERYRCCGHSPNSVWPVPVHIQRQHSPCDYGIHFAMTTSRNTQEKAGFKWGAMWLAAGCVHKDYSPIRQTRPRPSVDWRR